MTRWCALAVLYFMAAFSRYAVLEKGVNLIDTSPFYGEGLSELFIGQGLKGISRDKSLSHLQLSHVDLLQVHDVEFASSVDMMIVNETLPAVQRLKERGLCRYIGITGYPLQPLREIITRSNVKIDSVLSYARLELSQ